MKMRKLSALLFILVLSFALIVGCGNDEVQQSTETNQSETVNNEQTDDSSKTAIEKVQFPVSVTDALGNEVTIEKQPERIVSLIPSNTEITFALGLGDAVVGVSDYDNYPKEVEGKEKIGAMEFNVEKIISLSPDLVLAHASIANSAEAGLKQLRDGGIHVVVVNDATSFQEVYASIEMIAKATGTEEKGKALIEEMQSKFTEIEQKASLIQPEDEATVWVEVSPDLYTTGKGTFMNEMLTILHAKNAARDKDGWVQYTEEDAVQLNPDVIITTYGDYVEKPVEQVLNRKAWAEVNAVKNKRVFDVNSDTVTRSGPRLVDGVEELAKTIYPEIFTK